MAWVTVKARDAANLSNPDAMREDDFVKVYTDAEWRAGAPGTAHKDRDGNPQAWRGQVHFRFIQVPGGDAAAMTARLLAPRLHATATEPDGTKIRLGRRAIHLDPTALSVTRRTEYLNGRTSVTPAELTAAEGTRG